MTSSTHDRKRRRFARLGAVVALGVPLVLAVGGCDSLDFLRSSEPQPPPAPAPAPQPPEPARTGRLAPAPPPRPAAPPPAPEINLVGLSQSETESLLGPPTALSDRPPAKVWEYRANDCTLDIYFYLDVGRNAFYALHYDSPTLNSSGVPATASAPDAADRCLRRVYNAHRQP